MHIPRLLVDTYPLAPSRPSRAHSVESPCSGPSELCKAGRQAWQAVNPGRGPLPLSRRVLDRQVSACTSAPCG